MNVLDLAAKYGHYKRVSPNKGGEYHGPCPFCGGDDRFHIWPAQKVTGDWWCRGCDKGGDLIQFFIEFEGMSFPEACKAVGRDLPEARDGQTPQVKRPAGDSWQPTAPAAPAEMWREHAEKFVEWSFQQLLALGEEAGSPLYYLASRGIRKETAIAHRLGWNLGEKGKDLYRAREAWGLETILNGDKKKKLWIPRGLVIPYYADNCLRRVRIRIPNEHRTPEFSTPYYVLPGSSMDTYVINPNAKAYVIIEAELDGILVAQEVADSSIGAMAMGNNSAKPTEAAYAMLTASLHISDALDYDFEAGNNKNPGGRSGAWWKAHFEQSERWPPPVGKDPGEAFKAGCNIREWIKAGLPPIFNLPAAPVAPKSQSARKPTTEPSGIVTHQVEHLIRDAASIVSSRYPTGALEWLTVNRQDLLDEIKQAGITVDRLAFIGGNALVDALKVWTDLNLAAWQEFKLRPPVLEVQETLLQLKGEAK